MRLLCCAKHSAQPVKPLSLEKPLEEDTPEHDDSSVSDIESSLAESNHVECTEQQQQQQHYCCLDCVTRLFHHQTNTLIGHLNRRSFISDGEMYDEVSRFCMGYAQKIMIRDGDLQWVQIKDDIQALVSRTHPAATGRHTDDTKPTLLVVTGKGKVRAGIFSSQYIQTTGLEPNTALFIVREAKKRNMNIIMLDPNRRGEREAYAVVKKSIKKLFGHIMDQQQQHGGQQYPLFIKLHSAAGSHVVRYLMDY